MSKLVVYEPPYITDDRQPADFADPTAPTGRLRPAGRSGGSAPADWLASIAVPTLAWSDG